MQKRHAGIRGDNRRQRMTEKIIYEYDIETDENKDGWYTPKRGRDGWEVYKTEVNSSPYSFLWMKGVTTVKTYHIRRDITPVKVSVDVSIDIPRWKVKNKEVTGYSFNDAIQMILRQRGIGK
jgi:hypothetical protein